MDIANSFNINKNAYELFETCKDEDIKVLHGIRFLSASYVVLAHTFTYVLILGVNNGLEAEKALDTLLGEMLLHLTLTVDTFFLMSAILLVNSYRNKTMNPMTMLVKRYFRLIFPLAVIMYFLRSVYVHTGSGPLWPTLANQQQTFCQDDWWRNLLMINNYKSNLDMCHAPSWSISCEYQLAILGICLLYVWRRAPRSAGPTYTLVATLALLIPGIITYWNKYTAVLPMNFRFMATEDAMSHIIYLYLPTHSRAASYVLGLGIGHFMFSYRSANYKGVIFEKYSLVGCFVALCVMVGVLVMGGHYNTREPSALEAALFVALNRTVWALAVGLIMVCCQYGHLTLIANFLSWHFFVPLSRLSYGIYLIHTVILSRMHNRLRSPRDLDMFNMVVEAMGVIVASCVASLVMYLLVEAPSIKLCNLLLHKKKINMQKNKQENGKIIATDKTQ